MITMAEIDPELLEACTEAHSDAADIIKPRP